MISAKLVLTLLTAISRYTGYAIPGDPPQITLLPHAVLEQRVCGQPCQVFGFTLPSGEIVIDEALPIGRDPVATSILVHELTHFLQMKSVSDPQPTDCQIWSDREHEAFSVQIRWLRDRAPSIQVFSVEMARLNFRDIHTLCTDRPAVQKITPP